MKFFDEHTLYFTSFILFFWLITFNFLVVSPIPTIFKSNFFTLTPKLSNYWIITNEIHIDNNWSASEAYYDFISGSGTFNDPFIIENITIKNLKNGNNVITIENSLDYFIIRNCKITGSGASIYNAEINIINSTKGIIINNTISSNVGTGISLIKSNNISITENTLFNNSYIGIGLNESQNNYVYNNIATYNGRSIASGFGIILFKSHNNSVSRNTASYNTAIGILLGNSSYNNITLNTVNYNYLGVRLTQSSNFNNIIENNLKENTYCFIVDTDSEGNVLKDNDCGSIGFEFYFFLIAFGIVFSLSFIGLIIAIKRRRKIKKERKTLK